MPDNGNGDRDPAARTKSPLKVRFHYMVGNHDWYYHLKGEAFDQIRREIIDAMGLSNPPTPFPYDLRKIDPQFPMGSGRIAARSKTFQSNIKSFAATAIVMTPFNFDAKSGRDHATLGDVFTMEVCNRYPGATQTDTRPEQRHCGQPAAHYERPPGAGNTALDHRADQKTCQRK